eukprot:GEMP01071121.1.p1 GENE.GEMP01071121.1~~GEMP01071121.1.p1  ORF type:complete len:192 (+),score=42.16 GEMP01071121.1:161-736(+)
MFKFVWMMCAAASSDVGTTTASPPAVEGIDTKQTFIPVFGEKHHASSFIEDFPLILFIVLHEDDFHLARNATSDINIELTRCSRDLFDATKDKIPFFLINPAADSLVADELADFLNCQEDTACYSILKSLLPANDTGIDDGLEHPPFRAFTEEIASGSKYESCSAFTSRFLELSSADGVPWFMPQQEIYKI